MTVLEQHFAALTEIAGNMLESADLTAIQEWGREYKKFSGVIETKSSANSGWSKSPSVDFSLGPRLRELMIRLIGPIQQYLARSPMNTVFDVLDAECGFGHGTDLLASMYLTSTLGYRLRVVACCSDGQRLGYLNTMFRTFICVPQPLASIRRQFDLVLSPFGAQRYANVVQYLETLQGLARQRVFLIAPYAEPSNRLAAGHRSVIDDNLLTQVDAENVHIAVSPAWGRVEGMKVVQFQLPGRASG